MANCASGSSRLMVVALVVVMVMFPKCESVTCGTVEKTLAPCFGYVLGGGSVPPASCCQGVKLLYGMARTTADRRIVCGCLKSVTRTASPNAVKNAKDLPGKCGLTLPYQITPQLDCNKVN